MMVAHACRQLKDFPPKLKKTGQGGCPVLSRHNIGLSNVGLRLDDELALEYVEMDVVRLCLECPFPECYYQNNPNAVRAK